MNFGGITLHYYTNQARANDALTFKCSFFFSRFFCCFLFNQAFMWETERI